MFEFGKSEKPWESLFAYVITEAIKDEKGRLDLKNVNLTTVGIYRGNILFGVHDVEYTTKKDEELQDIEDGGFLGKIIDKFRSR